MKGAWAVMRLGAPHEGHAELVGRMLEGHPREPVLVLIGSSDTTGRPDVPLPWETRRDILGRLLEARGSHAGAVDYAPLPEIPIPGFTREWFEHVLAASRAAVGCTPGHHYFGEDYALESFGILLEMLPGVRLHRVPRAIRKSGTELRRAVATREPELLEKYRLELGLYPASALERIERASLARDGGGL